VLDQNDRNPVLMIRMLIALAQHSPTTDHRRDTSNKVIVQNHVFKAKRIEQPSLVVF